MKKTLVSAILIITFIFYGIVHNKLSITAPVTTTPENTNNGSSTNSSTNNGNSSPATSSGYKDGTYVGSAANAFYGNIQVQATISSGKVTNVTFLQFPNTETHSIRINQQADPVLAQEAIQAQSAQVDIVSGATDTSEAFIQSLTSALNQAKS